MLKHDRLVGVLVSAEDYEAMRRFYSDRLIGIMDETAKAAALAGLTPDILAELLSDES